MTFSLTAFFSWAILTSLVTVGHPFELIKYNFMDVAKDQWWYFGLYGPSTRVFEFSQLPRLVSSETHFPLTVLVLASVVAIKTKKSEHVLLAWIGLTLFAGGSLASLGGHIGGYFGGFCYWGIATTILAFLRGIQLFTSKKVTLHPQRVSALQTRSILLIFFSLLITAASQFVNYKENVAIAENDPGRFYVPEFGGYLSSDWKDYISYARQNKDRKAIEDYWGIWNSLNGNFPQWPVDSVIHALGSVRNTAQSALVDADLIISTRYATSPTWQPWNLSQNFWFYDELLFNWEPDFSSPTTIVWRKIDSPREYTDIGCRVSREKNSFILESEAEGFYRVALNYTSAGAGRYLLMLKNNISFGADAGGYVSLPPGRSTATIPALITPTSGNIFGSKVVGSNKIVFQLKSCTAKKISLKNNELLHVRSQEDIYLTDGNWIRGISRRYAGFFVPNEKLFQEKYQVGKSVKFNSGEFRKITDIASFGEYLHIYVEGPLLDPDRVGFPDEFMVVDTL